ncbi:MAG: phosphoenolpyruvate--protein phosphotransferase [Fusobacteria bacterium]|jgi:phosphotransferase system enzyme I (PtsI)|nr:phosphoenolpyruvate--protein phosphotransferase [Fusobacteriota bacterium]
MNNENKANLNKLGGISIYEGIVIAKPYIPKKSKIKICNEKINIDKIDEEIKQFKNAIDDTKKQLSKLAESLSGKVNQNDIKILNVHVMLLEDPLFLTEIINIIKIENLSAENAVLKVRNKYVEMFKKLEDPTSRERGADIEDVSDKVISNLQGNQFFDINLNNKILIAKEVKPSELLTYHNLGIKILGIITEYGGETSHVSILAKTIGIPTLIGVKDLTETKFTEEKNIILDTRKRNEFLLIDYDSYTLKWYEKELLEFEHEKQELEKLIKRDSLDKLGNRINLYANMGNFIELDNIIRYNLDGIGLLRTEFLYMESKKFPTEEEQFNIYKNIIKTLGKDKTLTIRTLDIGADKKLNYFEMPIEENPFLGLRAIRFTLLHIEIFKIQLRAILRASYYGDIQLMYPMISSIEELTKANEVLEECKRELLIEGIQFNNKIKVGIMVEVPSTAIMADLFVDMVDFFSIGTNDLTQYILAADRLNEEVSEVYDNFHPAVLRAINIVAEASIEKNKKISICGEMAGDKLAIIAFLSFGITNFSMLPSLTTQIKKNIKLLDINSLDRIKKKILLSKTSKEVKELLEDYLMEVM